MLNLNCSDASQVIAYEVDARMVAELQKRVMGTYETKYMHFQSLLSHNASVFVDSHSNQSRCLRRPMQKKLEIIVGDVIKGNLPYFDVCIANMPYQVCIDLFLNPIRYETELEIVSNQALVSLFQHLKCMHFRCRSRHPSSSSFSSTDRSSGVLCLHVLCMYECHFFFPPSTHTSQIGSAHVPA
jgi:hypothetical protein